MAAMFYFIAFLWMIVAVLQWFEKGIPLHNAYLWNLDHPKDRDWSAYYRQGSVVFFILGLANLLYGLSMSFSLRCLYLAGHGLLGLAIFYALVKVNKGDLY